MSEDDGRELKALRNWVDLLHILLKRHADALDKDRAAGGDGRQAAFGALLAVRELFSDLLGGDRRVLAPLDAILEAAIDVDRGHTPALFAPSKSGRPKASFQTDTVRVCAIAAYQILRAAMWNEVNARKDVVAAFNRAGVRHMVGIEGLAKWIKYRDQVLSDRVAYLLAKFWLQDDGTLHPDKLVPTEVVRLEKNARAALGELAKAAARGTRSR